jgi:hypothetical protein
MGVNGNGIVSHLETNTNGTGGTPRVPRRVVLLASDQQSDVTEVLAEYKGSDVSGNRLHADVQRLATEHAGTWIAAEWLGSRGWNRYLWCRR